MPKLGGTVWLLNFLVMALFFVVISVLEYILLNYLFRVEARVFKAYAATRANARAAARAQLSNTATRRLSNRLARRASAIIRVSKRKSCLSSFLRRLE